MVDPDFFNSERFKKSERLANIATIVSLLALIARIVLSFAK